MYAVQPMLQLVTRSPLVVRGEDFKPGTRVRVVELAPTRRAVIVRVGSSGGFLVKLLAGDRCTRAVVVARPSTGGLVTLKTPPPLCPPP
jgi:hypothetical protein